METLAQAQEAGNILGPMLMATGLVVLSVLLTITIRGKIAARNAARPSPRQLVQRLADRPGERASLDARKAELVGAAGRLSAQLDNKAERLEILIRQADERLAALREAGGAGPASERPALPEPAASPPAAPETRPADPLARAVYELADEGRSPVEIAQTLDEQVGKVELILALRAA